MVTDVAAKRAKAHPTRAFFVRMLTRDISLLDCILDLIDNSVDAAWAQVDADPTSLEPGTVLAGSEIRIEISDNRFRIQDNCGGIDLNDAVNYAFTFGRTESDPPEAYAIGVYGIGLKRAVFKLGDDVRIRSTPEIGDPFVVPISVSDWMSDASDTWDFPIDTSDSLSEPGVLIEVEELQAEAKELFGDPAFLNSLRASISRDYLLPLMQGLKVTVNSRAVKGWDLRFRAGGDFAPMRDRYDEGDVSVEIIAGMVAPPPKDTEPSLKGDNRSGWYVLCNGRVVVAADKTQTTVWGRDRFPTWHRQYEGFVGVVLFSSAKPALLPMTTTKKGVDEASLLYRRAVTRMIAPTRAWIDYTNSSKSRRQEAREREGKTESVPIGNTKPRKKIKVPNLIPSEEREANVLYAVPINEMRNLAKAFGNGSMSYRDVGLKSFRYAYRRLVDDL